MSLERRLRDAADDLHRSVAHFEPGSAEVMVRRRRRERVAGTVAFGVVLAGTIAGTALLVSSLQAGPEIADRPPASSTTAVPITVPETTVAPVPSTSEAPPQSTAAPPSAVTDLSSLIWTRVSRDDAIFGDAEHGTFVHGVAAGDGGWLAVGTTGPAEGYWPNFRGTIWSSADGVSWVRGPDHEDDFGVAIDLDTVTFEFWGVTATEAGWVVVGYTHEEDPVGPAIWTSPDGSSWSRVTGEVDVSDPALDSAPLLNDVAARGSRVVAVGRTEPDSESVSQAPTVWLSEDAGLTWEQAPDDEAAFGVPGDSDLVMNAVTAGPSGFVAVGAERSEDDFDAAVWTSADGSIWARAPHDESALGGPGTQAMIDIVATEDGYVAVGHESLEMGDSEPLVDADRDAAVWVSPDGITWIRVPHDEAVFGGEGHQVVNSVAAGPAGIIAVGRSASGDGYEAAAWGSPDGLTWTRLDDIPGAGGPLGSGLRAIAASGNGFVTGGWIEVTGNLGSGWVAALWSATPPEGGD